MLLLTWLATSLYLTGCGLNPQLRPLSTKNSRLSPNHSTKTKLNWLKKWRSKRPLRPKNLWCNSRPEFQKSRIWWLKRSRRKDKIKLWHRPMQLEIWPPCRSRYSWRTDRAASSQIKARVKLMKLLSRTRYRNWFSISSLWRSRSKSVATKWTCGLILTLHRKAWSMFREWIWTLIIRWSNTAFTRMWHRTRAFKDHWKIVATKIAASNL